MMLLQFLERRTKSAPARATRKSCARSSPILFAEEMIDVAREAGEYNNIAM
jgi:hypothetical protein